MTDENDLFTGDDDVSPGDPLIPNDESAPAVEEKVDIWTFLFDLSYREAHSFVAGFGPLFTGLLLLPFFPSVATIMVGISALLTVVTLTEGRYGNSTLRYIIKEPHYFYAGLSTAGLLSIVLLGLTMLLTAAGQVAL